MNLAQINTAVASATLADHPSIMRSGKMDLRIARTSEEIRASQALRYQIFYEELGATPPNDDAVKNRIDCDEYDNICDHLLVIDHGPDNRPHVVGSYRLLRQVVASQHKGFYSSREYDLSPLFDKAVTTILGEGRQLLELGRSCIAPPYRNARTITMLWRGIASYLQMHSIGFVFGCASFPGTDPEAIKDQLSYLYHNHLASEDIRVRAHQKQYIPMNMLPDGSFDVRAAWLKLPPLIKGYLRVGGYVGDGAYIDHKFNTTDVFILLPVDKMIGKYTERFSEPQSNNDNRNNIVA